MKRTLTAILLCLTISTAQAHLESGCNINGFYQVHIVDAFGCTTTVSIDNGTPVNVLITSQDQIYLVSQPVITTTHFVQAVICGNVFTLQTGTNTCTILAFGDKATYTQTRDSITVTWELNDESKTKQVQLVNRSTGKLYYVEAVKIGRKKYKVTLAKKQ